jgi:phage head maturation protease
MSLPGAFGKVGLVPFMWQHRLEQRIGRVISLEEDEIGLHLVAEVDKKYPVGGLSFGYRAVRFERHSEGRDPARVWLFEVSLVTHPMNALCRAEFIPQASNLAK